MLEEKYFEEYLENIQRLIEEPLSKKFKKYIY